MSKKFSNQALHTNSVDALSVFFTVAWLLLFFWLYAQVHHRKTHQRVVSKDVLEEELRVLADSHKESLLEGAEVSHGRYRPISRNSHFPVNSGSRYPGGEWSSMFDFVHFRRQGREIKQKAKKVKK